MDREGQESAETAEDESALLPVFLIPESSNEQKKQRHVEQHRENRSHDSARDERLEQIGARLRNTSADLGRLVPGRSDTASIVKRTPTSRRLRK